MPERTCSIEGCGKKLLARSWCGMHYRRWRLYGDPGGAAMLVGRYDTAATERPCSLCKRVLPLAQFPRVSRGVLGIGSRCDECEKRYHAEYYKDNRRRILIQAQGYQALNAESIAHRKRAHYLANREAISARVREYERARPDLKSEWSSRRRARMAASSVTPIAPGLIAAKLAYWGGRCWMCGGSVESWDHVKPLSRGGAHILANLRPACRSCNSRKSNRWPFPTARRS